MNMSIDNVGIKMEQQQELEEQERFEVTVFKEKLDSKPFGERRTSIQMARVDAKRSIFSFLPL